MVQRWIQWSFLGFVLLGGCHYSFDVVRSEALCSDSIDNDHDGLTDCLDPDCAAKSECSGIEACGDGIDNDHDGLTDCDDNDCSASPACVGKENCTDGQDNDHDGKTDCDDEDCVDTPACTGETNCTDGVDNDANGKTDCDDDGCKQDLACLGPMPCNDNQVCESEYEDRRWCADCVPTCSLDDGEHYDYIVSHFLLPTSAEQAAQIGWDLDGDGDVDNDLGGLIALTGSGDATKMQSDANEMVQNGTYILLGRIIVNQWPKDDVVAVQIFDGNTNPTADATEDNLTGSGQALIAATAPRFDKLCGSLSDGRLLSGPGKFRLPLPLFYEVLYMTTEYGWIVTAPGGSVTETNWQHVIIAGGWTQATIDAELLPEMARYLSLRYKEDPQSNLADTIRNQIDGHCINTLPGCEDMVNGQGDCVVWDENPNTPVVTATELKCSWVSSFFRPTVDMDGDGIPDIFPIGVEVSAAVHVTISN